jgi:predicted regulator of Ras-like GTPase activity (Roadblock/LC7/MglB family)
MATLPQLVEEDIQRLDEVLREFVAAADARVALVIDKGGFLITHQGEAQGLDLTSIAALSSGAYLASQTIASLVNEVHFDSIYQQGENHSLIVVSIDESCMLVVIFKSQTGVGLVKYFAAAAVQGIASQLKVARKRAPGLGLDLSVLNVAEPGRFFRKSES